MDNGCIDNSTIQRGGHEDALSSGDASLQHGSSRRPKALSIYDGFTRSTSACGCSFLRSHELQITGGAKMLLEAHSKVDMFEETHLRRRVPTEPKEVPWPRWLTHTKTTAFHVKFFSRKSLRRATSGSSTGWLYRNTTLRIIFRYRR
ncbi:hypothetical protein DY000_02010506 [Brassica cretica]|uniref:Uncharacterized protein n=1 Tax=Brassica cretica TaxID=69181 RepID=A0ABQ7BUB2_BRACR|nr:hypothetical protein DY000_02010506 [Brassica cretica]